MIYFVLSGSLLISLAFFIIAEQIEKRIAKRVAAAYSRGWADGLVAGSAGKFTPPF